MASLFVETSFSYLLCPRQEVIYFKSQSQAYRKLVESRREKPDFRDPAEQ